MIFEEACTPAADFVCLCLKRKRRNFRDFSPYLCSLPVSVNCPDFFIPFSYLLILPDVFARLAYLILQRVESIREVAPRRTGNKEEWEERERVSKKCSSRDESTGKLYINQRPEIDETFPLPFVGTSPRNTLRQRRNPVS